MTRNKIYKTGMFGGKFLPIYKGHAYCIEVAAVLFHGGADERENNISWLSPDERIKQLRKTASLFDNVIAAEIDISDLRLDDGFE